MGSPFIQADADAPVSMEWQGEKWQGSCGAFTATFNNEGVITALRNAEPLEVTLKDAEILITSSRGEALYGYLRAFTKACLPDVTIIQLKVTQAEVGSSGSFLTCEGAIRTVTGPTALWCSWNLSCVSYPSACWIRRSAR